MPVYLMSVDDMNLLDIYLKNFPEELFHVQSSQTSHDIRNHAHLFVDLDAKINYQFTNVKNFRLHRKFGHPSVDKPIRVLSNTNVDDINEHTRQIHTKIERSFQAYQTYAQRPLRFKFTLCDDSDFNNAIYIGNFYIDEKPILHVVDESKRF